MAQIAALNMESRDTELEFEGDEQTFASVRWCRKCQVPLLFQEQCPLCSSATTHYARDLKPVFDQERRRFEALTETRLPTFLFVNRNHVYFNGQTLFSFATDSGSGLRLVNDKLYLLDNYGQDIYDDKHAEDKWQACLKANQSILDRIRQEAIHFVQVQAERFADRRSVIAFSGGKDSAVTALLVRDALGNVPLLFGDTTIEFPPTYQYVRSFASSHGFELFWEKPAASFFDLCDVLEPPSRIMRWCCTVCKSQPINKFYTRFADHVLSFDGIRRMESNNRASYPRVVHVPKFARQIVARPIVQWSSFAVWLYMIHQQVEHNPLYDLGYSRVGCMYCPGNTPYNDLITKENFTDLYDRWIEYLLDYAHTAGKVDPRSYVLGGFWKSRRIGKDRTFVVEQQHTCRDGAENTYVFENPLNFEFLEFLKPFGKVSLIGSPSSPSFVVGSQNPFVVTGSVGGTQLSVSFSAHRHITKLRLEKQIEKYLNCVHCGGCLGVCPNGAISIRQGQYHVDENACNCCGRCTTTKYLKEGCVALNFGSTKKAIRRE